MGGELHGGSTSFDATEARRRWPWRHATWIAALVMIVAGWAMAATAQAAVTGVTLSPLSPATILADGSAKASATATVTGDAATAGQVVSFASAATGVAVTFTPSQCTTTAGTGNESTCTVNITGTAPGTAQITATADSFTSTPAQTLTLTEAASTITVALAPPSIIANGTATTTATATVKAAQGNLLPNESVVFTSNAGNSVSATTNATGGNYTATITSTTTVGAATITATAGTATGSAMLTQTPGPASSMSVAVSPAMIVANGTDTATATATVIDAQGHPLPSESALTFSSTDKGQFFGQISNGANGTYTVQIRSSTTVGRATITATDGAASNRAFLDQAAGPSTTSIVSLPAAPVTNQTVSLFAAVRAAVGSPSGTMTFASGGAPIIGCIGILITPLTPSATCQTSFAASTSPRHLTAVFTADAFSTVTGSAGAVDVPVAADSTSVTLTVPAVATTGQGVTFTATVGPPPGRPGPVLPLGTVQFLDNGVPIPLCTAQPLGGGSAQCTIAFTSSGTHKITARYVGDQNFAGATSSTLPLSVVAPPVPVLGTVTAVTQWSFYYTPTYTRVLKLIVKRVSIQAGVTVKCQGRGCPYASRTIKVPLVKRCGPKGKTTCPSADVNVGRTLANRHLSVGTVITIIVRRPRWVAKYYAFTVRAGKAPTTIKSCMAPDGTKPGVGCTP